MSKTKTAPEPIMPPDEKFWQRYSPHHEAPLSGMTSLFLHGVVVGLLLIVGYLMSLRWHGDAAKPPSMDLVMIEGGGDGLAEGLGGPAGLADGSADVRTELVPGNKTNEPQVAKIDNSVLELDKAPSIDLMLPETDFKPEPESKDLLKDLETLTTQAKAQAQAPKNVAKSSGPTGPKGVGGKGGIGDAPGPGKGRKGLGPGAGGMGGLTKQQIFAQRWRFQLYGDGKMHADKLATVGVTLALLDPRGQYWVVRDLNQRPADLRREDMTRYKEAVKWYNGQADSIFALARELQIPFIPKHIVLLLPKDREQKMADAEARYAQLQNRDVKAVQETWFDFQLRGNDFEPVVIRMK